ncbi:MAG TPA: hypothetical protein VFA99_15450 [Acidobacteriaceae bacterium]|nr:hypothetical protein [Acidobacteriaceae bacterium]
MPGRRFELYFSWSRPAEIGSDLGILENRYPTLFELRRATWPEFEELKDVGAYNQGTAGFLDDVVLSDFKRFREVIQCVTGQPVGLTQRVGDDGLLHTIDSELLQRTDTLIVVSLDHLRTSQTPTTEEVELVMDFLRRENSCLIICPHHFVGDESAHAVREQEFKHHGDLLVPEQQRIGGFARELLRALGFLIENRYGLRPARSQRDFSPAPLQILVDSRMPNVLQNVTSFNLHAHLPHLYVGGANAGDVVVMAKQYIDLHAPSHPFVEAGNTVFNALLWVPPAHSRGGHIFICDATLWSSAFSGLQSLQQFWKNLAVMSS